MKGLSGLAAQVGFGFGHRKHWPGLAGTAWRRRPLHTAGGAGGQCGALSADLVLPTGAWRGCLGVQQFQRTKWRTVGLRARIKFIPNSSQHFRLPGLDGPNIHSLMPILWLEIDLCMILMLTQVRASTLRVESCCEMFMRCLLESCCSGAGELECLL